jgi:hypothetical protein
MSEMSSRLASENARAKSILKASVCNTRMMYEISCTEMACITASSHMIKTSFQVNNKIEVFLNCITAISLYVIAAACHIQCINEKHNIRK